jgi:serine/threonine protein kinase
VPKVIDFGIAKATRGKLTDQTFFTALEQFIGTPAYMSPEQADAREVDIDTRSDIYSLGVLLYELLTGHTPFDAQALAKEGLDAMRRTIREVEPPRPSTRLRQTKTLAKSSAQFSTRHSQLSTDLDWITMKCLEKDRARRYETANGLAMDLRRYLDNELVSARPPSAAYRLQKNLRRNKKPILVAAVTTVVLALLAGIGVTIWQRIEARKPYYERVLEVRRRVSALDVNWSVPQSILFNTSNTNLVHNLPKAHPYWYNPKSSLVLQIKTYHWNDGRGAPPGTITMYGPLVCDTNYNIPGAPPGMIAIFGRAPTYGPWQATGYPSGGDHSNLWWVVQPNIVLSAGWYGFNDSSDSTWSWNSNSVNTGFTVVSGW